MASERVIRDPIHNLIRLNDSGLDRLLTSLMDCAEFQRLRRIRQLGFSELVFPGATHTRFAHSLGVMHIAKRMLQRLRQIGLEFDEGVETVVLCGALLHDVGHGPFSHAFEKITQSHHERYTRLVIEDPDTQVHNCLKDFEPTLPERISAFFDENPDENGTASVPAYMVRVITSQFDADRADYLLRDSLATGTHYGRYDLDWLIEHLHVDTDHNRFYFDRKSIPAVESYVFARFHMYQSVYYHKATRAAEVMLKLLFKRYKELLARKDADGAPVVPDSPLLIQRAFQGQLSLQDYLGLDEAMMLTFFGACIKCSDLILAQLSKGLLERRLYKAIEATGIGAEHVGVFCTEAAQVVSARELAGDYAFVADSPADRPYKPYQPDRAKDQIFVEGAYGQVKELTEVVDSIQSLTKKREMLRYYCAPELRDDLVAIRERVFKEG